MRKGPGKSEEKPPVVEAARDVASADAGVADPPLGRALYRVMRALMFEEAPLPEMDVLPLAQLRLLWTIFYSPSATMKDFSERLSVSQSTITQLAERLVRRGLVERCADPVDRRVVRLQLSPMGTHILHESNARQRHTFLDVWEGLTSAERSVVIEGLNVLGRAGEAVRAAQGRRLSPWSDEEPLPDGAVESAETNQPVVDLMARRVRGRVSG